MTCNGKRKIVLISVTSLNFSLIFRSKTYLKMVICDKCNIEGCAWSTYQEDLIRYWLQCRQCGRPFGEIGRVEDCNRRARKICCIKHNSYVTNTTNLTSTFFIAFMSVTCSFLPLSLIHYFLCYVEKKYCLNKFLLV